MANTTSIMKSKTDYLTMNEINTMLLHCYNEGKLRDYMLIKVLSRTGRRVTEVVGEKPYTRKTGLRPCDILDNGLIEWTILKKNPVRKKTKVGNLKTEEAILKETIRKMPKRILKPIDDLTLSEIQYYISEMKITPYARIFPITARRVRYIIHGIAKKCGISRPNKNIHPHIFRHSFAIYFLKKNNTNPAALIHLQELLDHSKLEVTKTYLQFSQEDKKIELNKTFEVD